jgi:hypothetical protein
MIFRLKGGHFFERGKGGRIMKHAALLLGIVTLFIFAACGKSDKGEQPAESEYQGAVQEAPEQPQAVPQTAEGLGQEAAKPDETLGEKTGEAVEGSEEQPEQGVEGMGEKATQPDETLGEKTGEAVETFKEKTGEAVEGMKEKAAQPFQGMAEKMGGHADAAKEALGE